MDAIELVRRDDPAGKALLYACPKCGALNSPGIYLAREEVAHQTAREAAENCYSCREHNTCTDCGEQCSKHYTKCDKCRKTSAFAKAEKIDVATVDHCFGYGGDFYCEVEEAEKAGEPWVFASTFTPYQIDPNSVLENVLDNHHEDASVDDLNGVRALVDAIQAFNEAQTSGTYFEDRKRIAVLTARSKDRSEP